MPGGVPRYIRCYDNRGDSADRYTVLYTGQAGVIRAAGCANEYSFVSMSEHPYHPQGVGLRGSTDRAPSDLLRPDGRIWSWPPQIGGKCHLGWRILFDDLPFDCQRLVLDDYTALWRCQLPQSIWYVRKGRNQLDLAGESDAYYVVNITAVSTTPFNRFSTRELAQDIADRRNLAAVPRFYVHQGSVGPGGGTTIFFVRDRLRAEITDDDNRNWSLTREEADCLAEIMNRQGGGHLLDRNSSLNELRVATKRKPSDPPARELRAIVLD